MLPTEALRPAGTRPRRLDGLMGLFPAASLYGADAADVMVAGCTHDSRLVRPGDLYAALPGSREHGASFAAAAAAAGATVVLTDPSGRERVRAAGLPAVVVENPRALLGAVARWVYAAPAEALLLLGVTGTNGKTTTAYLLEAGLRAAGHTTGLLGTIETRVAGASMPSLRTTPEAPELQALLAVMRERGVTAAAMEVSSHALALGRVDGTRFRVAAFTNLSQDHLDFHANLADYLAAKARLFAPDLVDRGVLNVDDPAGEHIAGTTDVPVTTVSAAGRSDADWRATRVAADGTGSTVDVVGPAGAAVELRVRLAGGFNAANGVLALATLASAGVELAAAAHGVGDVQTVPGRMERVEVGQPFLAVVDYAHSPRAVTVLLDALREVTKGRLLVVLGCGGDRDRDKRPLMGAAAARGADVAVLTSDNPRSEDPLAILAAMTDGARAVPPAARGEVVVEPSRPAAIAYAVSAARPGDTVVVAGRGHEPGQELADRTVPFDDRAELRAALHRLGGAP